MEKLFSNVKFYYSETEYINLDCQDIKINSSNDTLTDTCDIIISKLDTFSDYSEINIQEKSFKLGCKVEVNLGYGKSDDPSVKKVYTGYMVGFHNSNQEMILNFEDEMYLLKNTNRIKKSYISGGTLSSVIDKILTDSKISDKITKKKIIDIKSGTISLVNYLLPSEILTMLKDRFGIFCFFKNGTLYLGHKYWGVYESKYGITGEDMSKTFQFKYPNVKEKPYYKIVQTQLDYTIIDKDEYKVKGSSINQYTGITYEYPVGIQDPKNIITISLPDTDLPTLTTLVKEAWENLDKGGFTGTFKIFGYPFIQHGDVVELEFNMSHIKGSPRIIKESYYIDEVLREFGTNGYKQTLKLGNKLVV